MNTKAVSGSIIEFANSCPEGVTCFHTGYTTKDLPSDKFQYSNGLVFVRNASDSGSRNILLFGYYTCDIALWSGSAGWTSK